MLTDSYLAGFFDADGHAQINKTGSGNYVAALHVTQVTKPILSEFVERFGGKVHGPHPNGPHSDRYRWSLYGPGAISAAIALTQHSFVKTKRLNLIVEFGDTMNPTRQRLAPGVQERRQQLHAAMAVLNQRGKQKG